MENMRIGYQLLENYKKLLLLLETDTMFLATNWDEIKNITYNIRNNVLYLIGVQNIKYIGIEEIIENYLYDDLTTQQCIEQLLLLELQETNI